MKLGELSQEKTQLTPYEMVMAYIANVHDHVDQDVIAKMYGVNSGRVAEAVNAIAYATANITDIYKLYKKGKS